MGIHIRFACAEDSERLILLTALTPMDGAIRLRIDRGPDFFALTNARGPSKVLIAVDDANETIIGSFSFSNQTYHSFHRTYSVVYLADLKVHPDYSKTRASYLLVRKMFATLLSKGADLLYCTAVNDNFKVMPFFGGRAGIPSFMTLAIFKSYQILPRRSNSGLPQVVPFNTICDFYKETQQELSFRHSPDALNRCTHVAIWNAEGVTAAASLFDPGALKQHVALGIPVSLKIFLACLSLLKGILQLPVVPETNKPLRILFVRNYAFRKNKEKDFLLLISQVRAMAHQDGYHLVSICADTRSVETTGLLKRLSFITFVSKGFITSLHNNLADLEKITAGPCLDDFSLT